MQKKFNCRYCRASGKRDGDVCPACGGNGHVLLRMPVAQCHSCSGEGEKNGRRCRRCHGVGSIEVSSHK